MRISYRRGALVALSLATTLAAACSTGPAEPTGRQADSVLVHEQWVKAADSGMTAAFAELRSTADTAVRVVSASSPASARVELHEIAPGAAGATVMRPKTGGFVIPAGGTYALVAGGDHVMLMDLLAPLTPGAETEITLVFEDSSSTTFTAQVRDFAGAQENYEPGGHDPAGPVNPAHSG
ncbi:copper chaperone PCu(A)C [Nocardia sp. CA-290969]|uniref:copper chaperone PCu(A)C n=1 Tax=Nocardia sp. CA-290969 TaxID=3239986 RepID=UPI003D8E29BF